MAHGLKPSDNPEIVREFETRLLLVVFPVLCFFFFVLYLYIFFYLGVGGLFFFYLGVGAAVLCCHFSVHLMFICIPVANLRLLLGETNRQGITSQYSIKFGLIGCYKRDATGFRFCCQFI